MVKIFVNNFEEKYKIFVKLSRRLGPGPQIKMKATAKSLIPGI